MGRFCSIAGRVTKLDGLSQQLNQPQPSLGKFLLGGLEGRSALQRGRAVARLGRLTDALFCFSSRSTEITGLTSCYVLLILEFLVHLASLLRRTGKCLKTYREVRYFVPGSASDRTGKCATSYREVRFEKSDTQLASGRLYREVRRTQLLASGVYREVLFKVSAGRPSGEFLASR
jgi:hypothetical protein